MDVLKDILRWGMSMYLVLWFCSYIFRCPKLEVAETRLG